MRTLLIVLLVIIALVAFAIFLFVWPPGPAALPG
jgi:hypothetical protein